MLTNNDSSLADKQIDPAVETEVVKPIAKPITTSFTYTSTGIRLAWSVKGIDVESILVSSAEDGKDFTKIKTLAPTTRFLNLMKTDTTGSTKFQITTTSSKGETFSSTVGLRGRFTIEVLSSNRQLSRKHLGLVWVITEHRKIPIKGITL